MKLYCVRHGQTNYNVLNLCNDDPSKPVYLTDTGISQAKEVAEKLKDIQLDCIYISEFPRTLQTATIINHYHQAPIMVDVRINDRKTGFDGLPFEDFYLAIKNDIFHAKLHNGESFQEEKARVRLFLSDIQQKSCNNILVVTHKEIMQIVFGLINTLPDDEMWNIEVGNCSILESDL